MKLSVALCTYNGEKYIQQQLESILNQELPVDEIVIVDDCSTDNTWGALNAFKTKFSHIKIYQNKKNLGYLKNFERAINLCTGDIILLSDQDDIWERFKSKKIYNHFQNSNIKCVISELSLIDTNSEPLEKSFFKKIQFYKTDLNNISEIIDHLIFFDNFAPGAGMAIRRKKVSFKTNCPFIHDGQLLIDSLKDNSCVLINEPLTRYRIHSYQSVGISQNNSISQNEMNNAISRYQRAVYIHKKLKPISLDEYKTTLKKEQTNYLIQFKFFGRLLRRIKWLLFPPY